MKVPANPKQGCVLTAWRITDQPSLVQFRWTYYLRAEFTDVTGDPKFGAPFVDEWYVEQRYYEMRKRSLTGWHGSYRSSTRQVREDMANTLGLDTLYDTFKDARLAALEYVTKRRDLLRKQTRAADATHDWLLSLGDPGSDPLDLPLAAAQKS